MIDFTQIGSLPFTSVDEALDYSFTHSIPFVPDLPALCEKEFMLSQAQNSRLKAYEQLSTREFLNRVNGKKMVVKNQLPGPMVIKRFLKLSDELSYKIFLNLLENRIFLFSKPSLHTWIFIDEPSLGLESFYDIKKLFKALEPYKKENISLAIHYCGKEILETKEWDLDIFLSFDTSCHKLSSFKGLSLIPGIKKETAIAEEELLSLKLVTPPCGLWGHNDPEQVLKFLQFFSRGHFGS